MRLKNIKGAKDKINKSPYIVQNPEDYKGKYQTLFKNNNKIHLEIGMGKGDFIINMAKKYPNINFIGKIDTIYLNFSDPWPKNRHEDRRLTSRKFLERYDNIFKNKKHIIQKTDNRKLFEFSIKSFTDYNYKIKNISLNLHDDDIDNVETEYEKRFISLGFPIYMIEVEK